MEPNECNDSKAASQEPNLSKTISCNENIQSSSSSSCAVSDESEKTSLDSMEKAYEDDTETLASRSSPEPNCAICLQPVQNVSFTDSCSHSFCFTCLVEWSKVKAVCPLCKQPFKSIKHNVRNDSFEEYLVQRRNAELANARAEQERLEDAALIETLGRTGESFQLLMDTHRMRYSPHLANTFADLHVVSRLPCPFRQRVYEDSLWVNIPQRVDKPIPTAAFYSRDPTRIRRLIPWLHRELCSLFPDNDGLISFLFELVLSMVERCNITGNEFRHRLDPHLGCNLSHFIHEFHAFAISPYDMETYDAQVNYGLISNSVPVAGPSTSVNHDIATDTVENRSSTSSFPQPNRETEQNRPQGEHGRWKILISKRDDNGWESYSPNTLSFAPLPRPSTSRGFPSNFLSPTMIPTTPELVDLCSDDDDIEVTVPVITVSSDEEDVADVYSPFKPTSTANCTNDSASPDSEYVVSPSTSKGTPPTTNGKLMKNSLVKVTQESTHQHDSPATEEVEKDVLGDTNNPPKLSLMGPSTSSCKSTAFAYRKRHFPLSDSDDDLIENVCTEKNNISKKLAVYHGSSATDEVKNDVLRDTETPPKLSRMRPSASSYKASVLSHRKRCISLSDSDDNLSEKKIISKKLAHHHDSSATEEVENDVLGDTESPPKLSPIRPSTSSYTASVLSYRNRRFTLSDSDDDLSENSDSERKIISKTLARHRNSAIEEVEDDLGHSKHPPKLSVMRPSTSSYKASVLSHKKRCFSLSDSDDDLSENLDSKRKIISKTLARHHNSAIEEVEDDVGDSKNPPKLSVMRPSTSYKASVLSHRRCFQLSDSDDNLSENLDGERKLISKTFARHYNSTTEEVEGDVLGDSKNPPKLSVLRPSTSSYKASVLSHRKRCFSLSDSDDNLSVNLGSERKIISKTLARHHDSATEEVENDLGNSKNPPKLSVMRPSTTEIESSYKASVLSQRKRRFSLSDSDDSLSENSDSERKINSKKLKL